MPVQDNFTLKLFEKHKNLHKFVLILHRFYINKRNNLVSYLNILRVNLFKYKIHTSINELTINQ